MPAIGTAQEATNESMSGDEQVAKATPERVTKELRMQHVDSLHDPVASSLNSTERVDWHGRHRRLLHAGLGCAVRGAALTRPTGLSSTTC